MFTGISIQKAAEYLQHWLSLQIPVPFDKKRPFALSASSRNTRKPLFVESGVQYLLTNQESSYLQPSARLHRPSAYKAFFNFVESIYVLHQNTDAVYSTRNYGVSPCGDFPPKTFPELWFNYGPAGHAGYLTLPLTFVTVISGLVLLLKTMTRILLFSVRIIHSCSTDCP